MNNLTGLQKSTITLLLMPLLFTYVLWFFTGGAPWAWTALVWAFKIDGFFVLGSIALAVALAVAFAPFWLLLKLYSIVVFRIEAGYWCFR